MPIMRSVVVEEVVDVVEGEVEDGAAKPPMLSDTEEAVDIKDDELVEVDEQADESKEEVEEEEPAKTEPVLPMVIT